MHSPRLTTRAIIGWFFLANCVNVKSATIPRDEKEHDALERHLDMSIGGWPHGACAPQNDFSNWDSRADIWFHGHGGDLVEYYLRNVGEDKHSNEDWAQSIFKILLPTQNPAQMSCNGSADSCTIGNLACDKDFREWPAAFYTFISLQNIHTFFAQYLERLTWMKTNLTNDMEVLVHDFKADKESDKEVNIWAIIAAALSMGAGASAAVPAVSGALGAFSAFASLVANTRPGESGLEELGQLKSNLATIINTVCESAYKSITDVQDAIYGHAGGDEKKIPEEMLQRTKYSSDYQHPTALALGNGQWLLDHPAEGMRENFDEVGKRVKQTLALQLLRLFHKAYLIITPGPQEACTLRDQAWDSEAGSCYTLVKISKEGPLGDNPQWGIVDISDISEPLWNKYGANQLATFRNIVDCWVTNKGKIGTASLSATSPGSDIKQCFFSIEVKKGKFDTDERAFSAWLNLVSDDEFPNFPDDNKRKGSEWGEWEGTSQNCTTMPCSMWPWTYQL